MYRGQPQIKMGLVSHPDLDRKPRYPIFLLHRTQGQVQIKLNNAARRLTHPIGKVISVFLGPSIGGKMALLNPAIWGGYVWGAALKAKQVTGTLRHHSRGNFQRRMRWATYFFELMGGNHRFLEKTILVSPYGKVRKGPLAHSECS